MDTVEAIIHDKLAEGTEAHVDRRMDVSLKNLGDGNDDEGCCGKVKLYDRQRNTNQQILENLFAKMGIATDCVKLPGRMMNGMHAPEETMLEAMLPIREKIVEENRCTDSKKIAPQSQAERRNGCERMDAERTNHERDSNDSDSGSNCTGGQVEKRAGARTQRVPFDGCYELNDRCDAEQ